MPDTSATAIPLLVAVPDLLCAFFFGISTCKAPFHCSGCCPVIVDLTSKGWSILAISRGAALKRSPGMESSPAALLFLVWANLATVEGRDGMAFGSEQWNWLVCDVWAFCSMRRSSVVGVASRVFCQRSNQTCLSWRCVVTLDPSGFLTDEGGLGLYD